MPILVEKIKFFEKKKQAKVVLERNLITWIWRRRIRKLKDLKKKEKKAFMKKVRARASRTDATHAPPPPSWAC